MANLLDCVVYAEVAFHFRTANFGIDVALKNRLPELGGVEDSRFENNLKLLSTQLLLCARPYQK